MAVYCYTCSRWFVDQVAFDSHAKAKKHAPYDVSYPCADCDKGFGTLVGLESHQKAKKHGIHATEPHTCQDCFRELETPEGLESHQKAKKHGIYATEPHTCQDCSREFETPEGLESHSEAKRHGKYAQKSTESLQSRIAVPFRKSAYTPPSMSIHFCEVCQRSFLTTSLKQHFRTSTVHPSCDLCSDAFKDQQEHDDVCSPSHYLVAVI